MKAVISFRYQRHLLLCSTLLILLTNLNIFAQSDQTVKLDAGTGGRNTLQGDIYTPMGQRLDRPIMVKLNTPRGEISTTTNSNGSFTFRQLVAGRYTLRIDAGEAYVPALEVVDIIESGSGGPMSRLGQTYTVQVHLRLRAAKPTAVGVVSADAPPKAAIDLYEKALASVKAGNRDKAIKKLKEALVIHPSFVAALNGLGVQYMKLGDQERALEAFRSALKLSPDSFILHLNCGITLVSLKRFAEAESELQTAILKNNASGPAYLYRARALIGLGRFDDAEQELRKAIERGGEDVVVARRYLGGIYVQKGENAKAIHVLEEYLTLVPESSDTLQIRRLVSQLRAQQKHH